MRRTTICKRLSEKGCGIRSRWETEQGTDYINVVSSLIQSAGRIFQAASLKNLRQWSTIIAMIIAIILIGQATFVSYDVSAVGSQSASLQPLDNIIQVSAGDTDICALTGADGVKCWGWNLAGALGDGTTAERHTPVDVIGLGSSVAVISAGTFQTCAVTGIGGVKCWGWNKYGQLGDGTTVDRSTPVDVTGLSAGVKAISAVNGRTCAVTGIGGVKCWGWNKYGQLGDGTTVDRSTPVDVIGLSADVKAISVGGWHTCVLVNVDEMKCWGDNAYGQLGDGTTINRNTPVNVTGLQSGVKAISAGVWHTCALTSVGTVKCWGKNDYGQLGDGTTGNRYIPVDVIGLDAGVKAISDADYHTCAITNTGGAKCWGDNENGQLGDGTIINRNTPVNVTGLESGVTAISTGVWYTCALTSTGGIKCWGANGSGQLGDGTTIERHTPVDVMEFGSNTYLNCQAGFRGNPIDFPPADLEFPHQVLGFYEWHIAYAFDLEGSICPETYLLISLNKNDDPRLVIHSRTGEVTVSKLGEVATTLNINEHGQWTWDAPPPPITVRLTHSRHREVKADDFELQGTHKFELSVNIYRHPSEITYIIAVGGAAAIFVEENVSPEQISQVLNYLLSIAPITHADTMKTSFQRQLIVSPPKQIANDLNAIYGADFISHTVLGELQIDSNQKLVGESLFYTGTHFNPNGRVYIAFTRPGQSGAILEIETQADNSGNVLGMFHLPNSASAGRYLVVAVDVNAIYQQLKNLAEGKTPIVQYYMQATELMVKEHVLLPLIIRN